MWTGLVLISVSVCTMARSSQFHIGSNHQRWCLSDLSVWSDSILQHVSSRKTPHSPHCYPNLTALCWWPFLCTLNHCHTNSSWSTNHLSHAYICTNHTKATYTGTIHIQDVMIYLHDWSTVTGNKGSNRASARSLQQSILLDIPTHTYRLLIHYWCLQTRITRISTNQ